MADGGSSSSRDRQLPAGCLATAAAAAAATVLAALKRGGSGCAVCCFADAPGRTRLCIWLYVVPQQAAARGWKRSRYISRKTLGCNAALYQQAIGACTPHAVARVMA